MLAENGADKIFGVDLDPKMLTLAEVNLTQGGVMDKFTLFQGDIHEPSFCVPNGEKVDCVVLSFSLTTFVSSYEQLETILSNCIRQLNETGYLIISDFAYVNVPKSDL
jgi:SAM-dependent methyltransferase